MHIQPDKPTPGRPYRELPRARAERVFEPELVVRSRPENRSGSRGRWLCAADLRSYCQLYNSEHTVEETRMKATLKLKKITICNMDTLELEGGLGTAILDTPLMDCVLATAVAIHATALVQPR